MIQKARRQQPAGEKVLMLALMLVSIVLIAIFNSLQSSGFKSDLLTAVSAENPYAYYFPWDASKVKYLDLQPTISATGMAASTYYDSSVGNSNYQNNDVPFECCCYLQQQRNTIITSGNITVVEEGEWLPLKKVFCATSYDEEITYEYSIDFSKLQRLCRDPECNHRLWLTSTSKNRGTVSMKLNSGSFMGCGSREYGSFCLLLVVFLLLSFDYLSHSQTLAMGIMVSFILLAASGRFPTADKILEWINASTAFFVVVMVLIVGMLKEINFFPWMASVLVRYTSSDPIGASVALWVVSCVLSAFFPTVPLAVLTTEMALEVCEILQIPSLHVIMGLIFMINIGGSISKYGSFLTISMCKDFGISFGEYFSDISLCTFIITVAVFFAVFLKFGIKIKDYPITSIFWTMESTGKDSDEYSSGSSDNSSDDDDNEYEIGIDANGVPIRRSASGHSFHKKRRNKLHRRLYLEDYKLKNPAFAVVCIIFAGVFFVLFLLQDVTGLDNGICAILIMFLLLMLTSPTRPPTALKKIDTSLILLTVLFFVFIGSLDELGLNSFTCK